MKPEQLLEASDDDASRPLVLVAVADLGAATEAVRELRSNDAVAGGFALLLALDASAAPLDAVTTLAATCIDSGLFWVSTWGPGCERIHDIFDEADLARLATQQPDSYDEVMSTWHDDESLKDTFDFFWNGASPRPPRQGGALRVVLSVGLPQVEVEVRQLAMAEREREG